MELTQQLITSIDTEYEIVITKDFEMDSHIKGYHAKHYARNENQTNPVDKYAVCVKREIHVTWSLDIYRLGNLENLFYFLRSDEYGCCNVYVKGTPVNLGDGEEGMQVPCRLKFTGR